MSQNLRKTRTRMPVIIAMINGIAAGATRALADWLLSR